MNNDDATFRRAVPDQGQQDYAENGEPLDEWATQHAAELTPAIVDMRTFIEHAPVAVAMFDADMNYLAASGRWIAEYGRGRTELVGCNHYALYPDLPDEWKAAHRKGLAGAVVKSGEDRWDRADGGKSWLRWAVTPWRHPTGEVGGIIISADDITEHKLTEQRLAEAKEVAEQASRAKDTFLANMSHEIRTPLNVIIGLGHLLQSGTDDPVQQARLDNLCATSDHLLAIINDVLELSKIEAGSLMIDCRDFRLDTAVDKVARMVEGAAQDKGLTLTIRVPSSLRRLWLRGDPLRLVQVLVNLCGNAIKFTEQGAVTLSVAESTDGHGCAAVKLRFTVEDTGAGISPADQARLFQPFSQVDNSSTRPKGGSGLGLAISRELVARMGGTIKVTSQPGLGSTFSFELEFAKGTSSEADAHIAPAAWAVTDFGGRRVLFAEDHLVSQEILLEMLEAIGCEVHVASDGIEAVQCARAHSYDAILLDLQMPRMDGLTAARAIRRLPGHRDTPIIALTANAFAEDRKRCLDAGMNGHIGKPVTPATLAAALGEWMPDAPTVAHGAMPTIVNELSRALTSIPGLDVGGDWRQSPGQLVTYCSHLERFVTSHKHDMAAIRSHIASGKHDAARAVAHTLIGIAGLMGARRVATLADDLLAGLRANLAEEDLTRLADACETEFLRLEEAVRTIFAGADPC